MKLAQYSLGLLFLTLMVGRFYLRRFNVEFNDIGLFQEIRVWFLFPLAVVVLGSLRNSRRPSHHFAATLRWLWVVILLFFYMSASATWATDLVYIWQVRDFIMMTVLLLIAWHLVRLRPEYYIGLFFRLFFVASLIFALGGLFGPSSWSEGSRVAAFGGGPNVFVRIMGTGIISAIYLWTRTGRARWLLALPLLSLGAVQSGSRGGSTALLISLVPAFHYLIPKLRRKLLFLTFVIALLGMLTFLPVRGLTARDILQYRLIKLTIEQQNLGQRDALMKAAWDAFRQNPLCGIGLHGLHSHNFVLDFAAGGGVVAIVLLLGNFGCIAVRWFKPRSPEQTAAFCCAVLYLVGSLFSGEYYDARFMWVFFLFYMMPATRNRADGCAVPDLSYPEEFGNEDAKGEVS